MQRRKQASKADNPRRKCKWQSGKKQSKKRIPTQFQGQQLWIMWMELVQSHRWWLKPTAERLKSETETRRGYIAAILRATTSDRTASSTARVDHHRSFGNRIQVCFFSYRRVYFVAVFAGAPFRVRRSFKGPWLAVGDIQLISTLAIALSWRLLSWHLHLLRGIRISIGMRPGHRLALRRHSVSSWGRLRISTPIRLGVDVWLHSVCRLLLSAVCDSLHG